MKQIYLLLIGWIEQKVFHRKDAIMTEARGGLNGREWTGKTYHKGEVIIRQGEKGENMYVLQSGQVEVIRENPDKTGRIYLQKYWVEEVFSEWYLFLNVQIVGVSYALR